MSEGSLAAAGRTARRVRGRTIGRAERLSTAVAWVALIPVALLLRPYRGAVQDALIYVGRAIADRDPAGVGSDILFAGDQQTAFTAIRPAMRGLLAVLSPAQASMVLVAAGLLLWLAAAVALARQLTRRGVVPVVVCLLALPAGYGSLKAFGYAEAVATPRVFAEAAVLSGLAALTAGRVRLGWALLAAAAIVHPLMALPGLAIAGVLLALREPRWWAAYAAGGCAILLAALLGLPLAGRLTVLVDPGWLAILRQRSPGLFPGLWSRDAYGLPACQAASALLAGWLATGPVRRLLWSAVGVAACGLALASVAGALCPSVLLLQLQLWRALWPLAVLGNAGLAIAVPGLWAEGRPGRLVVACLALAWLSVGSVVAAAGFAALALGLHAAGRRGALRDVSPRPLHVAWAAVALLAVLSFGRDAADLAAVAGSVPADPLSSAWPYVLASGVFTVPLVAGSVAFALAGRGPSRRALPAAALGLVLAAAGLFAWDARDGERLVLDGGDDAALRAAIGPGDGAVLWLGDRGEAWWLAGRPSFFAATQGSAVVFSRALATEWWSRGTLLRGLGLVGPRDLAPWSAPDGGDPSNAAVPEGGDPSNAGAPGRDAAPALTPRAVEAVCADPRRPVAIVAPGVQLDRLPAGRPGTVWRPSRPIDDLLVDGAGAHRRVVDAFTIVRCAAAPPPDRR